MEHTFGPGTAGVGTVATVETSSRRDFLVTIGKWTARIGSAAIVGGCVAHPDKTDAPSRSTTTTEATPTPTTATPTTLGAAPTPSPDARPFTDRHLRNTIPVMKGPDVVTLQNDLNLIGCGEASPVGEPLVEDGEFGLKTEAAVITFQENHDLKLVDGTAGPDTQTHVVQAVIDGETNCGAIVRR